MNGLISEWEILRKILIGVFKGFWNVIRKLEIGLRDKDSFFNSKNFLDNWR